MAAKKTRHGLRERRLVDVVRKAFGKHAALTVSDEEDAAAQIAGYCSTGIDVLDRYVIGCGGFPEGRISEVFGDEGSCKTSLGYSTIAAVQRAGGIAGMFDVEYSFDKARARIMGVDTDRLMLMQPEHLEELFEMVKAVLDGHDGKVPLLLVWDSIASTNTKDGYALEAGDTRVGDVPRLMSQELKKLLGRMHKKRAHLMMINQTRQKIGVMFGSNITTPGGNAPKFYSSVRLWLMGGSAVKKNVGGKEEHVAKDVTIMTPKNRLSAPWRKVHVRFRYDLGWDNEWSTIEHAVECKLLKLQADRKPRGRKAYEEACAALGWEPRPAQSEEPAQGGDVEVEVGEE